MTRKIGNTVFIEAQSDQVCVRCKVAQECRDVVKPGEPICFYCATETEKRNYANRLFGSPNEN